MKRNNENNEIFGKTCRLCAKSTFNAKNLLGIFQKSDDDYGLYFLEYNLKIFKNDGLPQKICRTCYQALKRANEFIQKCKEAQTSLEIKFSRSIHKEFINQNNIKTSPIYCANDNQDLNHSINGNFHWNNSKVDNFCQNDYNTCNQYINDNNDQEMDFKENLENICKYCSVLYKTKSNLKFHLEKFHPEESPYLCLICYDNFPTKLQHSRHLKSILCERNEEKFNLNEKLKNNYVKKKGHNSDRNCDNATEENAIHKNEYNDYEDNDDDDDDAGGLDVGKNDKDSHISQKVIIKKRKKTAWEKDRIYECEKCDNIFDKFRELLAHRKLNHSDEKEKYLCDFCGKEFKKRSAYSDHRNIHTQETPHKCSICEKAFLNRHALKKHYRDMHSNKERTTFPCEICGKIFLSTSALQNHVKTHSEGYEESLFQCKYCSKKFKLLSTLTIHCNSHNKPKNSKHQCPECLQFFKRSDHMKEHLLSVHLKKFPFPCELCDKKFVTGAKRSTHVKLAHSGIRYPCNVYGCEKEFCSLFSLNRHKRKHNGEKRYKCEVCHETFATTKQISKHIETHKLDENVKKQLIELTYANIQKEVETIDA